MRRHLFRSLLLAGALAAFSVPVFSATNHASACSPANCQVTVTGGSTFDTFISPLTATIGNVDFGELPTQAQTSGSVAIPGSVNISVSDQRGNNQGFSVWLQCGILGLGYCLTSSQYPQNFGTGIPASDFFVTGPATDDVMLVFGDGTGGEGVADGGVAAYNTANGLAYPESMANPVLVGGECSYQIIGMSQYNETVPIQVQFPQELLTLPVSWFGYFTVNVVENAPPGGCYSAGAIDNPATGLVVDY